MEEILDEGEPELPTINSQRKRARTFRKRDEIPLLDEAIAPFIETPQLFETSLEIKMIAAVPFFHVSKQKRVELFSASLKDVEKAFQPKHRTDPTTKLFQKFHEFFELFSEKETNKLTPHRPYDHKINFIKRKQPGYGLLYSMSQGELQILKKFLDENFAKGLIRANSSPAISPVLFIRKPGGGFRLCVNYKAFNAITVKNKYPLPLIQEILNRLTRAKYFTKLNIVAVFNKIRMTEGEE